MEFLAEIADSCVEFLAEIADFGMEFLAKDAEFGTKSQRGEFKILIDQCDGVVDVGGRGNVGPTDGR
jgi:hypothetical protein